MGKHRTTVRSRRAAGSVVAAGAVPLIATLIGAGTAHADAIPVPPPPPAVPSVLSALPPLPALPAGLFPPTPDPAGDPVGAVAGAVEETTRAATQAVTDAVDAATAQFTHPVPGAQLPAAPIPAATPETRSPAEDTYPAPEHAPGSTRAAAPIEAPPGTLRVGDLEVTLPFDTRELNAGAARTQEQLTAFLDSAGIERSRADRVAAQAMSSGLIGAGIGAAVAAPVAIPFAMVGAVAGFVVGLPFLPTGLVVGPVLGATIAYGIVTVPAAIAGAAIGAAYGATDGFTTQPFGPLPPL
ncbi:hypothetical protein [Nocardia sp. NBC_01329]|uniref:hypothetical protein n=1 Tax=Nocardia sp. NBC_01329 TaxID=2903594 RepID=UPI002E161D1A|nr:hypothetical protein OG405_09795 [Nocardia sp. NBC_01329]